MYRKNTAGQFCGFQMLLTATGAIATGLSPTVRRCIDGTFAAGGGTVTEDTGTGGYKYAMSQADTNGNNISFWFSAATAMPICINIVTTAADPTNATTFGLTNLDAAISTRMATYTQPTGFLAATFPSGTVANTTNITTAALGATEENAIADALLDRANGIETGLTPRQAVRVICSTTGGKLSGAGTGTETFRNAVADSANRVVATVDASGNRTAITYSL
jgi:hypothetical protein